MYHASLVAALAIASLAAAVLAPVPALAQAGAPDRCPQGLVWREVNPGDHVCVTPEVRARARTGDARTCSPGQLPQADGTCAQTPAPPAPVARDPFLGVTGPRLFLVIAPNEFMAALEPLVAHKNSTAMPTLAVSIAQLTSRF